MNINRSGSFNACTFHNTVNPIWLDGKFNTNIADNFFDVCLTPVFVMKSQGLGNTININNNNFRNYDGITTYDCFSSTINITNNLFNMFDANTTIPFSAAIYSVRAITIRELKGTLRLYILGNKMNNTREGIYCINVKAAAMGDVNIGVTNVDPDIFSNEYFNIVPQAILPSTCICYGYNFINCFKIKVAGNFAQWNSIPTLTELKLLRGISNTTGMSNSFAQNKTHNMGEFEGSVFYDRTSDNWRASTPREIDSGTKPETEDEQYGFSFGGPIVRDLLHYFVTYEKKEILSPRDIIPGENVQASTLPPEYASQVGPTNSPFDLDLFFGKLSFAPGDAHLFGLTAKYRTESEITGIGGTNARSYASSKDNDETRIDLRHQFSGASFLNDAHITFEDAYWNPRPLTFGNGSR